MRPSPLIDAAPAGRAGADADLAALLASCGVPHDPAVAALPLTRLTLLVRAGATAAVARQVDTPCLVHVAHEVRTTPAWRGAEDLVGGLTVDSHLTGRPRPTHLGTLGTVRSAVVRAEVVGLALATVTTRFLVPGSDGGRPPAGGPPAAPAPGLSHVDAEVTCHLTGGAVARFAALSGDDGAVHHDRQAARAAGFDDVVAHGSLLVALVEAALRSRGTGPDALEVRFLRPVVVAGGPGSTAPVVLTLQVGAARPVPGQQRAEIPVAVVVDGLTVLAGTAHAHATTTSPAPEETP